MIKNNKAKAIRFSTLDAICKALECQPSDILECIDSGYILELRVEKPDEYFL